MANQIIDITNRILIIRNRKVMLDRDLAELYGVTVKSLNQAVKRNHTRFPEDFMFQLNIEELRDLWSQNVTMGTINTDNYMKRSLPYVFTEAGAFALSFILKSDKATQMGQFIIRHLPIFVVLSFGMKT